MTKLLLAVGFALTVAFAAPGQAKSSAGQGRQGLSHKTTQKGPEDLVPVTQTEFRAAMMKLRDIVHSAIGVRADLAGPLPAGGSGVATRDAIVSQYARLMDAAEPLFKIAPNPVKIDSHVLKMRNAASLAAARKLIAWGFVAKVGPLVTGPSKGLTVQQFGDSLGFFVARLADVTHTPSIKWSPYLQRG